MAHLVGMNVSMKRAIDIQMRIMERMNEIDDVSREPEDENEDADDCENELDNSGRDPDYQCVDEKFRGDASEEDLTILSTITSSVGLNNYPQMFNLEPNSPFSIIKDGSGKEHVVRKSSICWLLNSNVSK